MNRSFCRWDVAAECLAARQGRHKEHSEALSGALLPGPPRAGQVTYVLAPSAAACPCLPAHLFCSCCCCLASDHCYHYARMPGLLLSDCERPASCPCNGPLSVRLSHTYTHYSTDEKHLDGNAAGTKHTDAHAIQITRKPCINQL